MFRSRSETFHWFKHLTGHEPQSPQGFVGRSLTLMRIYPLMLKKTDPGNMISRVTDWPPKKMGIGPLCERNMTQARLSQDVHIRVKIKALKNKRLLEKTCYCARNEASRWWVNNS